ncbi:hypothetical protein EA661_12855 [Pseudoxanthomonas winnipegensis]|uniref:Uncharacterized protein n=1 Tax=Pseudoxanthomonas winnipegensis TaxID=2480810 RepID=A0A4V2HDJ5_9GAMM|nr:hypothetical protein [Pseudoxanthomonas winnipegensis]TAA27640.1 hypothetical protein EA661_12855 [Pseudoxanthomonas winnipegensis]
MFDTDPSRLSGPDFLLAVADAELANGNEINAAVFRQRASEWKHDQALASTVKPRVRVPADKVAA